MEMLCVFAVVFICVAFVAIKMKDDKGIISQQVCCDCSDQLSSRELIGFTSTLPLIRS
jgi:hypothetical protein